MNRQVWLKGVNLVLLISIAVQAFTGISLFLRLFISQTQIFTMISEVHEYNGLLLVALVAAHIYLNWGWVRANLLNRK